MYKSVYKVLTSKTSFFQGLNGRFEKYKIECQSGNDDCKNYVSKLNESSLSETEIPQSQSKFEELLYSKQINHSGLRALKMSFENGRSPRNIYIVILFDGEDKSYLVSF